MFRRLISSCVLAGFVVAQWAAMPHGHAPGTQLPDDHWGTPHIHLSSFFGSPHQHEHGHKNDSGDDHRHDTLTGERECVSDECRFSGTADHDRDAVYLPSPVSISATGQTDQSKLLAVPAILHFADGAPFLNALPARHVASRCPPDERVSGCALYLALRTLRI